jgi:hypothetical protein
MSKTPRSRHEQTPSATRSELVRELIDRGLDEQPMARSIGHLKGRLSLSNKKGNWREHIRERNWR